MNINFTSEYIKTLRSIVINNSFTTQQIQSIIEPLDLEDLENDIKTALKDKNGFKKENEIFLTLQKVLWNEIDINDIEWKDK